MKLRYWLILLTTSMMMWNCETSPTDEHQEFLNQVISANGGLEQWNNIAILQFEKTSTLYDSSGVIESRAEQIHHYTYRPNRVIEIVTPKTSTALTWDSTGITKRINDTLRTQAEADQAQPSMKAATFVMELPYRLAKDEVALTLLADETLDDWGIVKVLECKYDDASGDIWRLYFEPDTYLLRAYRVQHADHISYVVNEKVHEIEGLYFPHERKSYRINEQGEKLYLRAAYTYENMNIGWLD
ncbi:MAG: hypothetical protein AAGI23_09285 [Bacteroidota bacterium]